jgi:2-methylisocitrate lyase-like PEP mutase family enzyme
MQPTQAEKAERFRALHKGDPFLIPNPWDAGSAKVLAGLGFEALATTSSGFAFTLGRADGNVTLDEVVKHVPVLDQATPLPVSVDLENGYGPRPEDAALAIARAAGAGAVGGSIEDFDRGSGIYDFELALERVAAAAATAAELDFPFTFTARTENHLHGDSDLEETILRIRAFDRAGADVLYAPGLRQLEDIRAVCAATAKPVNVLAFPGVSLAELVDAGAQRISVGGWLAFTAVDALIEAATQMRDVGDFSAFRRPSHLNDWLGG